MNEKYIFENTIYRVRHGSMAYGTNIAGSDVDEKGICILPDPSYYFGFNRFEQKDGEWEDGNDRVIYDIRKFIKLALDCNPSIIEILFVDESDILDITPAGQLLRDARDIFLSRKAAGKFMGYALSQLHRIKNHKVWQDGEIEEPKEDNFVTTTKLYAYNKPFTIELDNHCFAVSPPQSETPHFEEDGVFVAIEHLDKQALKVANKKYHQYLHYMKNRNPKRAALEKNFGYDCYSDDTEFLTKSGWKHFDNVTDTDLLATVDSKFKVVYQPSLEKFDGNFTGNMYNIKACHIDTLVTPNHRMLFRKRERKSKKTFEWKLEQAALFPDTFELLQTITPKKTNYSNKQLTDQIPIKFEAFISLMGWFLADGTITFYKDKPKRICISQKKGGRLHRIMSMFHTKYKPIIGGSFGIYKRKPNAFNPKEIDEVVLSVTDDSIRNIIFNECGHSENKRIPRWVFDLSKRHMEMLFDSMVRGDGTTRQHKTVTDSLIYYTSLPKLADDVQELAFLCGWETSLYGPYKSVATDLKGVERESIMYQVHVRKDPKPTYHVRSAVVKKIPVNNQRIVCFSVKNGTLVTRRKGHVAVHGNCKHGMHLIRLLRMGVELIRDGKVIVRRPDREELLDIRHGKVSYEKLIEMAEKLRGELNEALPNSPLPEEPNTKAAHALLIKLVKEKLKEPHGFY